MTSSVRSLQKNLSKSHVVTLCSNCFFSLNCYLKNTDFDLNFHTNHIARLEYLLLFSSKHESLVIFCLTVLIQSVVKPERFPFIFYTLSCIL